MITPHWEFFKIRMNLIEWRRSTCVRSFKGLLCHFTMCASQTNGFMLRNKDIWEANSSFYCFLQHVFGWMTKTAMKNTIVFSED